MTDHLGCEELAEVVANIAPRLHVFGHIHGGQGRMHGSNGCEFVNASVLDEHYMLVSEPEAVDLEISPKKGLSDRLLQQQIGDTDG